MNDLLTAMSEMSELRFLHKKKSKNKCTVPKKVFLLCQIKRGNLYHCSQLECLLSYFSSLCVLLKHSMLDPYAKETYRDMLTAGFLARGRLLVSCVPMREQKKQ